MMLPWSRETKPVVWLVLYWTSQWLLAAGWILAANTEWGEECLTGFHGKPRE
jgi:hypothetical protein